MAAQDGRGRPALGGAAIIVVLLLIAAFIFSIDEFLHSRRPTFELVGVFPEAPGIGAGSPVWLAGKSVGEVVSVSFNPPGGQAAGSVVLQLEVPASLASQVREDSEIELGSPQLLGAPVVRVRPGSAAAAPLRAGDTLWAAPPDSMDLLLARLPQVLEQADTLMTGVERVMAAARGRGGRVSAVQERLDLAAIQARRLDALLESGPARRALGPDGLRADVARLQASLDTLRTELGEMTAMTGDSAEFTLTRRALAARVTALRQEQAKLDSLLSGPYGTLGRFQADSAVAWAVVETRAALDSLFLELRAAPLRLFF